jgi:hypothetical protein
LRLEVRPGLVWSICLDRDAELPTGPQRLCRSLEDERAILEDAHVRGDALHLVETVTGQEHRDVGPFRKGAEEGAHILHPGWVEAAGRFVQKKETGLTKKGQGKPEALSHARRIGCHWSMGGVAQGDRIGDPVNSSIGDVTAQASGHDQILAAGKVIVEGRGLDEGTNLPQ